MEKQAWSIQMADTTMSRYPAITTKWAYEWGLLLKAILNLWQASGQEKYSEYVKSNVDRFVGPDGSIQTYHPEEYNLDNINAGKLLFPLWRITHDERYQKAAYRLKAQLDTHPRTQHGGFWHKLVYTHQMWLDGIYMASPFLAELAAVFNEPAAFDEVFRQITLIDSHTYDPQTGLFYHGWDESKSQQWAHPKTGASPHFWGRAMGWYAMALLDVLDHIPPTHAGREVIGEIFKRTMSAVLTVQDSTSGLWYQVLDLGTRPGNYLEASASCMFTYALAKGFRCGYLDSSFLAAAQKAYLGILDRFIEVDSDGQVNLTQICSVAGLGGIPYRDGTFEYYIGEKIVDNDFKGVGPFILAAVELEYNQ